MNEANGYEQAHLTDTFIEPHVHPDVDSYFREKLASASARKQREDKLHSAEGKKLAQRLDTLEANEALLFALRNAGKMEEAKEVEKERNVTNGSRSSSLSSEVEIQRLRESWIAAARGNFTAASTIIADDIRDVSNAIATRRASREPNIQAGVKRYDALAAELSEWQAGLQETPVGANSRLGRQINRTVVGLIQERDNTGIGNLAKQLQPLQRAQKAITTLQSLPDGMPPATGR